MVNIEKIDNIDRKIIYELDLDARISAKNLGKKLRISRERADYRIKRLLGGGVIRKFVCMINPSKLGYSIYKMYFKFQNISSENEEDIVSWFVKNNFVYWVAKAQGKWDLNITVFAKDINHFDEIISGFMSKYGKFILEQEFNTTLEVGIISKDWIANEKTKRSRIAYVGGKVEDVPIDKTDVEILKVLANNGRISYTELAKKIKSTERKVIYRIKKLEKNKIILEYTTSLDLNKLGMQFFKSTINFNTLTKEVKEKVVKYCLKNPNVGFYIFCVGSWPLELELIVKDNKQFYDIMGDFRKEFPEIKGYETMIFPVEYKFDWMPLCYKAKK